MSANLLVISDREEDFRFAQETCLKKGLGYFSARTGEQIRQILTDNPQTAVLWGADDPQFADETSKYFRKRVLPAKVFAVTEKPLVDVPHLFKYPIFGHHWLRRFGDPAPDIFAKVVEACFMQFPFEVLRYFPKDTQSQRIMITRSTHKRAAVDALQNVFTKMNVTGRLAALVAQACDELIMNAIFDAPVGPDGLPSKRKLERSADFELLDEREFVHVEFAATENYIGVGVSDGFGSLKKEVVLRFLGKDYQDQVYIPKATDPGAGLGLNGLLQAGLSMMYICKPGIRTEVIIFFPRVDNYKSFRTGFRFVSVLAE